MADKTVRVGLENTSFVPVSPATSGAQTDGTQKTQIVDAGGEAVTVTGGKLDVNATLTPSGTQDVNLITVAGAALALGQQLEAVSLPVVIPAAQITTLTPPAAITGFATSAKQDTLLAELQLKADLTETQPVSLATVPSHAVTNAGTFATQATEADGANVTLGAKADAKSTATDTTAVTLMQVLKQISYMEQNPASTPVTGTFYQATQPVSIATMPSTPVTGTFWQATQPVSGTVTANATLAAETTKVIGTVNVATSQTIAVTQATASSLNCTEASASAIKTSVEAIDNAVDGNYLNVNMNLAGTDAPNGAGTEAGVLRVTLPTDGTGVLTVKQSTASNLKTTATLDAETTKVIGTVSLNATTVGGCDMFKSLDLDETEEEVKGSAGQIYMIHAMNMKASVLYLKIYNNTAAGVTVGTTVPNWTFPVPTLATTNGAGFNIAIPNGIACGTGITVACTTGFADNDTGAPGANEMFVNIAYK